MNSSKLHSCARIRTSALILLATTQPQLFISPVLAVLCAESLDLLLPSLSCLFIFFCLVQTAASFAAVSSHLAFRNLTPRRQLWPNPDVVSDYCH